MELEEEAIINTDQGGLYYYHEYVKISQELKFIRSMTKDIESNRKLVFTIKKRKINRNKEQERNKRGNKKIRPKTLNVFISLGYISYRV